MTNRMTKLYLENFKSIKNPTTIRLAPITLLYGQNSVGKSAIIDAFDFLFYRTKDCGLSSLDYVYMKDSECSMVVGAEFYCADFQSIEWNSRYKNNLYEYFPRLDQVLCDQVEDYEDVPNYENFPIDVLFYMKGNDFEKIKIKASGEDYMELNAKTQGLTVNVISPFLTNIDKLLKLDIGKTFFELCEMAMPDIKIVDNKFTIHDVFSGRDLRIYHEDIYVGHIFDTFDNPFNSNRHEERHGIDLLLSYLFCAPINHCNCLLERATQTRIGPLRKIPEPQDLCFHFGEYSVTTPYSIGSAEFNEDNGAEFNGDNRDWKEGWYDGTSAWNKLALGGLITTSYGRSNRQRECEHLLPYVNDWLSSINKLDMPYKLIISTKYIHYSDGTYEVDSNEPDVLSVGLDKELFYPNSIVQIKLKSFNSGAQSILLDLNNVGSGVSQVIPILVAGVCSNSIIVEQPELHLHPKLQADITDFFIVRMNQNSVHSLIETHSEILALRCLRRIRETSKSDIMPADLRLDKDDVAFYYFDSKGGYTDVTELRVSDDGDFIDRWPRGFFSEREHELFDEDF